MSITFSDNFNDNSIDTAKWDVAAAHLTQNLSVAVAETGERISITPLSATASSNHNGLRADNAVDFTKGYAEWEIPQIAGADANAQTRCGLIVDAGNLLEVMIANTTITFRRRLAGANSDTTLAYVPATHRWFRMWHDGTNILFDTSPDGTTWTNRRSVAPGIVLTSVKQYIMAGTEASVAAPGVAIFDNVSFGPLTGYFASSQVAQFVPSYELSIASYALDLVPVAPNQFTIPMPKQRRGDRIYTTGTVLQYKATCSGEIDTFDIWLRTANIAATSIIFNLKINDANVFAALGRPTIASGQTHIQKTGVGAAVVMGDDIEITLEQVPAEGCPGNFDTNARVVVS